ncbi:MAG: outer membrane protein assembly factor BamA [bacterium]
MFKKSVFIIIYLLLHLCLYSLAEDRLVVIKRIEIQGNYHVKKRAIMAVIETKKGAYYDERLLQEDIQNIYKLGKFNDVTLDIADLPAEHVGDIPGVIATFIVDEKKIIKKIEIVGNKKISNSKIREEIKLQKGEPFDEGLMQLDTKSIEIMYRDKGYANVSVEPYSAVDEKTKKQIVTFYVEEGNRILITNVNISGTRAYKEKKIRKKMKTKRKKVFKQEILEEDLLAIENFYKNKGYVKISITEPEITYNEERTEMYISLSVDEGMRYRTGDISFEDYTVYTPKELSKTVKLKTNKIFQQEKLDETLQEIQGLYADKGYLRMKINTQQVTDEEMGVVNFIFRLSEGDVVYVDRIYIEGNTYTKEKVIRREIVLKEQEPFSAIKVRRSMEKIMNLGFLDDVQIDIQQPEAIDRADIVFEVKEGKPGMLTAGAGFSSVDGLLGTLQVSHINMFGRAQRLNAMWEFGERRQSYDLGFTEPWFLDRPVSFGVDVFDITRKRQYADDFSAYRERRRGGNLRLGPRITDRLSLNFTYSFEQIHIYDVDPEHAAVIQSATRNSSSVSSAVVYDTRDSIFDPTRGHYENLSVQVSGGPFGGDVHFYKPIFRNSYHLKTFWKFVISLSGRVGYLKSFPPSTDEEIFYERFYVGGGESVRGYDYRGEIGSLEGGNSMGVFNLEYGFPLVQENKRTILQFAIFADAGGAWSRSDDITVKIGSDQHYMKSGIGFGLRFKTPVFPIRLDWGYGLNHKPGEDLSQFYFTIGNVF